MTDEGKKRKASEIAEDADDSVEEAEAPAPQPKHPNTEGVGGNEGKVTVKGVAVETEAKVKGEFGGRERTSLARDEMTDEGKKRKASEIAEDADDSVEEAEAPAPQPSGVDLGYLRNIARRLTVMGEFDETRDDWGYQTTDAAGVERYLRLFASAQSFELQVLWMLLALECMQRARVSFHQFDEFKGAMRELHERERL
ncbi:hypothetical protein DYB26_011987 [Aphanomyces astaci]|uniref:Uncharacterized protein n=1 Tax=Aphanomyces astaci TaxID=112090 RepID=A0A397EN80_APHAT|nr:hypothetical protein DYB31_008081 [Aphanomyces astaci]RHZ13751.1 hypothetical protein DYB26_011987 [Aphanomyces astaci]